MTPRNLTRQGVRNLDGIVVPRRPRRRCPPCVPSAPAVIDSGTDELGFYYTVNRVVCLLCGEEMRTYKHSAHYW